MKSSTNKNSIILFNTPSNYSVKLENILNEIRFLNKINLEDWDKNIRYRSFWEKKITNLESCYYLDRGKWVDFILSPQFIPNENNQILNPFTIEEIISSKLRLALLLFWRDIVSKLDSKTFFKLQLKLNLTFTSENNNNNIELGYNTTDQVRSIGSVRIYKKENFNEALSLFISSLYFSLDNYSNFYVKNIILTFNICYEDSVLNNNKYLNFEQLDKIHSQNNIEKNKELLKIGEKKLPLTADITKWGKIQIVIGEYPYRFNLKETRVLISNFDEGNSS